MPRFAVPFLIGVLLMAHSSRSSDAEVSSIPFGNIRWFTLTNATGVTVKITNFGAIITSIVVPDRDGKFADVALGYDRLEDYINGVDKPYFGAIVGRFANRIAQGRFALNGQSYALNLNNGSHHLHGGIVGFDKVVWDARPLQGQEGNGVRLRYLAKDREEGYPGNLQVVVTYRLNEANELMVDYEATTDQATPVNLTQHTYFNLQGEGTGTILNHELQIRASKYTPIQANLIPTGEIADVAGTPLDFRQGKPIGRDLSQDHEQLRFGLGYDHNFVLDKPEGTRDLSSAATVYEPSTGRVLEISTTEPGIQFYVGNFLDGRLKGKSGKPYVHRGGFCLEAQHFPDSPNQPNFPSTILQPGDTFRSSTTFKFSAAATSPLAKP